MKYSFGLEFSKYEKVAEIIKRSDELKQQISDYREQCLAKVDSYTVALIEEVAEIEREQMRTQKFLHENHTAKIVKERDTNIDQLKRISTCGKPPFQLDKQFQRVLISSGIHREIELRFVPSLGQYGSLTHVQDLNLPKGLVCRAVSLIEGDKLLFGCSEYVGVYGLDSRTITTLCSHKFKGHNILSVDVSNKRPEIICLDSVGIAYLPKDLSSCSALNIQISWTGGTRLCAPGKYVVICNSSNNQVLVVNRELPPYYDGMATYELAEHEGSHIHSICSVPDESFLTLDRAIGIVCCYKLHENTTPTLRWSCTGIVGGYAICSDDQGLVYVSTDGKLYVLFEGTLVNTLECSQLPPHADFQYADITVRGNCLIATQHGSNIVRRFQLE